MDDGTELKEEVDKVAAMLGPNNPVILQTAKKMTLALMQRCETMPQKGTIELECSFGVGNPKKKGFQPCIPLTDAKIILTALERGRTEWESKEGWSMVYDTYVHLPENGTCRIRSTDKGLIEVMQKDLLVRADLCSKSRPELNLRLQAKMENQIQEKRQNRIQLLIPQSVRVSTRRTFVYDSKSMKGIKYSYTIIKAWVGRTAQEAEQLMADENIPNCKRTSTATLEIECEIPVESLQVYTVMYCCLGLLMKSQDILQILAGGRDMKSVQFKDVIADNLMKRNTLKRKRAIRK